MRNIILTAAIALISVLSAGHVAAQASADATIGATITTPQAMEKTSDLEIHTITTTSTRKGRVATTTSEEVTPAAFTVSGTPGMTYGVMTPETMSLTAAARSISIRTAGAYHLSATGTDKLSVTASLSAAAHAVSTPQGGGLDVTIVYN